MCINLYPTTGKIVASKSWASMSICFLKRMRVSLLKCKSCKEKTWLNLTQALKNINISL